MIVTVDSRSAIPPYEQLRAQLVDLITAGTLAPGTQLPPIRQLAKDLGIAAGTVARAYAEVERAGLVAARGRHGTVVADRLPGAPRYEQERRRRLAAAAEAFAAEVARLEASADEALTAARTAIRSAEG